MKILIEHLPPTGESAYFRSRYPRSWWWNPTHDFMASILLALQGANWQRGGGRGEKPKRIERPKDIPVATGIRSAADLAARKEKLKKEKQRRAQAK